MKASAALPGRPLYLAFLPDFLFRTDPVKARYVAKAWALTLLPSLGLALLVGLVAPQSQRPDIAITGPRMIFFVTVFAPLLETLLMTPPLLLLNRFAGAGPAVVGSALLWGVVHGLQAPVWGLVIWWPFLIFSIALLTWRERGIGVAMLMVAAIHGLQNSVPAALLLIGSGSTAA
jgi:membrane protease YdiL (CAAX protease family)